MKSPFPWGSSARQPLSRFGRSAARDQITFVLPIHCDAAAIISQSEHKLIINPMNSV
jgi:hypothetical protein